MGLGALIERSEVVATMFLRLARRAHTAFLPSTSCLANPKARIVAVAFGLAGLALGGCAQQPQQIAAAGHSKEYFPSSIYGAASRRVIADGQPVPHGGGQYLVGKPYTIAGQTYYPSERRVTQVGLASWYGDAFHGRLTANGEIYDRDSFTAAHPTMPLPSYARVTNLRNNTSMIVRVNDRGPYHSNRIMDVSRRVADALDIRRNGTAKVKVEWVARASLAGSDDAKLAATLRNGVPAVVNGIEEGIQVATAPARAVVASLGEFAPAPPRPVRYVEQQRPEALESYRAPRAAPRSPRHEDTRSSRDEDARDVGRGASRPARDEADDDTAETGSLRRRNDHGQAMHTERREVARRDPRTERHTDDRVVVRHEMARHVEARNDDRVGQRIAKRDPLDGARSKRGEAKAGAPLPPLRHPLVAEHRLLPPAKPVHLAALAAPSPPRKHEAASHGRSHGDR